MIYNLVKAKKGFNFMNFEDHLVKNREKTRCATGQGIGTNNLVLWRAFEHMNSILYMIFFFFSLKKFSL